MQYTQCYVDGNEPPHRFLGKIEEPADCMKDACYWTYPVEQLDAIKANPALMNDPEFNTKYACRLTEAQWLYRAQYDQKGTGASCHSFSSEERS